MTAGAILARLKAAGLHLRAEGGNLAASPKSALTDDLRALMRAHKAELLQALQPAPAVPTEPQDTTSGEALPSPLSGHDCMACDRLQMREEPQPGTRRRFFWRCGEGFELLQGRNYGERVVLAPPECDRFTPWKAGTK